MSFHHQDGVICRLCEEKLKHAHPKLVKWFQAIKEEFHEAHISCSYRSKEDQVQCYANGKSRLKYPHSKHNRCDSKGSPSSHALDIFELKDYKAHFDHSFFKSIAEHSATIQAGIVWGGKFYGFVDHVHFEIA